MHTSHAAIGLGTPSEPKPDADKIARTHHEIGKETVEVNQ